MALLCRFKQFLPLTLCLYGLLREEEDYFSHHYFIFGGRTREESNPLLWVNKVLECKMPALPSPFSSFLLPPSGVNIYFFLFF